MFISKFHKSKYNGVKLKMLCMHCKATLNPMVDVLLDKRDR